MNAARRTLGCWLLSAFLERGCDPTAAARMRRPVFSVRPLTPRELTALNPIAGVLVPLTNLRRLPPPGPGRRALSAARLRLLHRAALLPRKPLRAV
ncbi:MAG TPA: hypothetical protein VHQ90_10190 [Thermoanaerobaculia bacterium]|nr:hypothetical protein [Thermoanaerobaculia bacterium]